MRYLFLTALLALTACKQTVEPVDRNDNIVIAEDIFSAAYPLRKQFDCLPKDAAFIAGHRGVSKGEGFAENSKSSLLALIKHGTLLAEVDVAGLKDGTHILYHDGVWDEKSTGRGAVASSRWSDTEKILLHDTKGKVTSDRPVKLEEILLVAKDKIYLEIDFKSSAKYETVIKLIRDGGMADQVILIAYNNKQARRLAKLAPEMLLSVSIRDMDDVSDLKSAGVKEKNMTAWLGKGPYDRHVVNSLDRVGIPVLAWPSRQNMKKSVAPASVLVTDYAFKHDPILGLNRDSKAQYQACLGGE